jgi:hypothetical protein
MARNLIAGTRDVVGFVDDHEVPAGIHDRPHPPFVILGDPFA